MPHPDGLGSPSLHKAIAVNAHEPLQTASSLVTEL